MVCMVSLASFKWSIFVYLFVSFVVSAKLTSATSIGGCHYQCKPWPELPPIGELLKMANTRVPQGLSARDMALRGAQGLLVTGFDVRCGLMPGPQRN